MPSVPFITFQFRKLIAFIPSDVNTAKRKKYLNETEAKH